MPLDRGCFSAFLFSLTFKRFILYDRHTRLKLTGFLDRLPVIHLQHGLGLRRNAPTVPNS